MSNSAQRELLCALHFIVDPWKRVKFRRFNLKCRAFEVSFDDILNRNKSISPQVAHSLLLDSNKHHAMTSNFCCCVGRHLPNQQFDYLATPSFLVYRKTSICYLLYVETKIFQRIVAQVNESLDAIAQSNVLQVACMYRTVIEYNMHVFHPVWPCNLAAVVQVNWFCHHNDADTSCAKTSLLMWSHTFACKSTRIVSHHLAECDRISKTKHRWDMTCIPVSRFLWLPLNLFSDFSMNSISHQFHHYRLLLFRWPKVLWNSSFECDYLRRLLSHLQIHWL